MIKSLIVLAALLTSMLVGPQAVRAADFFYDHNGSRMVLSVDGSEVRIRYQQPRAGLANIGVRPGTLLFEGRVTNGILDGMSRIFNTNCGEIDYFVHGAFRTGEDFTLKGAAPVVSNMSCRIVDNRYDGPNANLVFTSLARANGTALPVGRGCVTGVRTVLNVRVGPGAGYGKIGTLPAGACGVEILARCDSDWCAVTRGTVKGWVSMRYLRR
ncbi:SH3 domain-containing protein [Jannaschia aquimarina]|uniref:Bacterial SH3 domain protein n=1 Tax=Jannaschia aquimarina TaxID=935700 RepID=A0A0D1EE31_9RHOB|nr:SH3 domain-containing protein [Jannaschia aquimarina]KIT15944.1 Bacterial SH3 domain protein [Jannaschia aquimarina]SNS98382.1 SH3 domain-containing protein [Jannaschia aquimarina]